MKKFQIFVYSFLLFFCISCNRYAKREITISGLTPNNDFDSAALRKAIERIQDEKINIHSILVERRGKILAEFYGIGSDKTMTKRFGLGNPFEGKIVFDEHTLHDVRSISKSVTSLLWGLEKYKNQIPKTTESVMNFYPSIADLATPERREIRFAHLLSMTSGLDWKEWGHGFFTSDETPLLWKKDLARYYFERPVIAEPGTSFNYSAGSTAILAEILSRSVNKPFLEIVRDDFFTPLGITEWDWATDFHGRPLTFSGLRLKPRDMLKIGRLVLQNGKWEGKQLVSTSWIAEALKTQTTTSVDFSGQGEELGYGYQWWTGKSKWKDETVSWSSALGNGGQRICIIPKLDLVVVTTAGDYGEVAIQRRVSLLIEEIIAAVR